MVFLKTVQWNRVIQRSLRHPDPHQDLPVLVPTMDTYQQADFVLSKVEQLYDQGVDYDQIAILYRAHFHAMELQIELSRRGMPLRHNQWTQVFRAGPCKRSRCST